MSSPLQAVVAEYAHHRARADALGRLCAQVVERAQARYPAPPPEIMNPARPGQTYHRDQIIEMDREARRRAAPSSLEAYDQWAKECRAVDEDLGIEALEVALIEAESAEIVAGDRVAKTPPASIPEAAIKFAVLLSAFADRDNDATAANLAFLKDLEGLATR